MKNQDFSHGDLWQRVACTKSLMRKNSAEMEIKMVFDREYMLNTLSAGIKEIWRGQSEALPDFLPVYKWKEKKENELRIIENIRMFQEQLNGFPYPFDFFGRRKRWKYNMEELFKEKLFKEPILGLAKAMDTDTVEAFQSQTKTFLRHVREFDKNLGIEDMGQALRNYIVYAIFLELNGLKQKCSLAIFGYSMLYPYTDNYIDDPNRTLEEKKHYNQIISDKIKGIPYKAVSVHEEKTAELLSAIEEDYQRPDAIYDGLLYMLEAQKNSQKQSEEETVLAEEDILSISIYKGGLSVLVDRYFINKPFVEEDFYFYYGFGFLLQLCDDLQDISQDKREGSRTVFSICRDKQETEKKINRLLHYTEYLFTSYESGREEFKQFLLRNCYFLILFSAVGSSEHVTGDYLLKLEERMPIGIDFLGHFKEGLTPEKGKRENRRYIRMLEALIAD